MDNLFLELDFVARVVIIIRIILVPMLLFNLSFTWRGIWDIFKGHPTPTSLYRAVLFLAFLPQFGFNTTAILSFEPVGEGPISLGLLLLFLLSNILAIFGRVMNQHGKFDDFRWLFEGYRLTTAIRVVRLSEVDPKRFEEYLKHIELELVEEVVAQNDGTVHSGTK